MNYAPVAFSLFGIDVRWYGIIYAFCLICVYYSFDYLRKTKKINLDEKGIENFFIAFVLVTVFCARFFDFVFYYPNKLISDPVSVLYIWNGGLSFHGGLIGMVLITAYYHKIKKINMWPVIDILAVVSPLLLAFGRIGNFINHELVGRVWNHPWCVEFATAAGCRYPSQLFEAFYSLILFFIMIAVYKRNFKGGITFYMAMILYGLFRFIFNFVRDDPIILFGLGMGQILSIIMIIIGIVMMIDRRDDL